MNSTDQKKIEDIWSERDSLTPQNVTPEQFSCIDLALDGLDKGQWRLAQCIDGSWVTDQYLKKAIYLSFRLRSSTPSESGIFRYFDKHPIKFSEYSPDDFSASGVRVVPGAIVRYGSYIAPNVILMPSYINVGSYVDSGTLIDIGAVLGSGAQIGKNCHISAGVVIGGVLEPIEDNPVIIEDEVIIGANCSIVGSIHVGRGSVLGSGVSLSPSTKIFNRLTGEISYGVIPDNSVVVPGSLPHESGCSIFCAVIAKVVDEKTRKSTKLNELLRDGVS